MLSNVSRITMMEKPISDIYNIWGALHTTWQKTNLLTVITKQNDD